MGLTNVIFRPATQLRKVSFVCINEVLQVDSGATIECAGACEECQWLNRLARFRNYDRRIEERPVAESGKCPLIDHLTIESVFPEPEEDEDDENHKSDDVLDMVTNRRKILRTFRSDRTAANAYQPQCTVDAEALFSTNPTESNNEYFPGAD